MAADHRRGAVWCGVDLGTTNTKVLLLAADGAVLARVSRPTPRLSDGIGPCTDADALVDLVETMIGDAHRGASLGRPIAAIAVAGTGEDGLPLGADLRPLDLAIPWNDRRAARVAVAMAAEPVWSEVRLPVPVDLTRTAAKWAWLHAHRPERLDAASCWVALTDYPAVRWTRRAFMSITLAARTACFDTVGRSWVAPLLAACGAPRVPEVLSGGTVVGTLVASNRLTPPVVSADTLVVAGGHDHPMAASLVCGRPDRPVLDSMGTAELVYVEGPPQRLVADPLFAASVPVARDGTAWLGVMELSAVLETLLRGPGPLGEPLRRFLDGDPVLGRPETGDPVYLPWMDPERFAAYADPGTRLRAIMDGCALHVRRLVERAGELAGTTGPVFVTGGWARSRSLLQQRAAALGVTLHRLAEPELAALGSAVLAAGACGADPRAIALATETVAPDPAASARYDAAYPAFRSMIDAATARNARMNSREPAR